MSHADNESQAHPIPLWGLFLALLALTAAEVALFEVWSHDNLHTNGHPFMPKFAMVLLLLAFTLPKAAIVMIYFMHLKFEKQLVILVAITPFATAALAVLPTLTDAKTLKAHEQTYNLVPGLGDPPKGEEHENPLGAAGTREHQTAAADHPGGDSPAKPAPEPAPAPGATVTPAEPRTPGTGGTGLPKTKPSSSDKPASSDSY